MKLISDIFGIVGILFTVLLYQQKERKSLLAYKITVDLIWLLHYIFIGAYSGAVVCLIAAVRETIFVKTDPRKKNGYVWLPIFIVIAVILTVFTWESAFSILTCLASCLAVVSFFVGKPSLSRIFVFPISLCMLIYDVACGSVMGIIDQSFAIVSSLVGILIYDREKYKYNYMRFRKK